MYLQSTDWPCASHWQGACKKTQLKLVPPMTITFLEFAAAAVTFILFCERENWQRCLGLPSLHSCLSFIERKQQNNSKSPNICYCGVVHEIISHLIVTREIYNQYMVSSASSDAIDTCSVWLDNTEDWPKTDQGLRHGGAYLYILPSGSFTMTKHLF